jgi:hypothetical protein
VKSNLASAFLIAICSAIAMPAGVHDAFAAESAIADGLDPDSLRKTSEKLDAYARLLGSGGKAITESLRYLTDFNFERGPTGAESEILELDELRDDTVTNAVRNARAAAKISPALGDLDASALAYADALANAPAIFNEAARYYSSDKLYLADHFERGKQLHPKIAAEMLKIFQTMPPFAKQLNDARKIVDPQEAAYVQKIGNSPMRLIARDLLRTGLAAASFVPTNSTREIDLRGFEAALDEFFRTVARYKEERARGKGSAADQVGRMGTWQIAFADMGVDVLVHAFRAVHDGYVQRKDNPQSYDLQLLGFYGRYSEFSLDVLDIIERAGWPAPRPPSEPARPVRPTPQVSVPDLSEADLLDWFIKARNVKALLVNSNELMTAWTRYAKWVDMAQGPTGKERGTGGFFAIDATRIDAAIAKARQLSAIEPAIPVLDDLLKRYADAMQSALPTAVEASGYYTRKEFLGDAMSGGQSLHPRLVRAYRPFLETREDLSGLDDRLREAIDGREIDAIESKEGQSANWRRRTILVTARKVLALAPSEGHPAPERLDAFDKAIDQLGQAIKALEAMGDGESGRFLKEANKFVGDLRTDRRYYGQPDHIASPIEDDINENLQLLTTQLAMMGQAAGVW